MRRPRISRRSRAIIDDRYGFDDTTERPDPDASRQRRTVDVDAHEGDHEAPSDPQLSLDPDLGDAVIGMYSIG